MGISGGGGQRSPDQELNPWLSPSSYAPSGLTLPRNVDFVPTLLVERRDMPPLEIHMLKIFKGFRDSLFTTDVA